MLEQGALARTCAWLLLCVAAAVPAQTRWDLPSAYAADNFHTANLAQFVDDVDRATAGRLKINLHANASLFKAPDIKQAVELGQAQIGEVLLANHINDWALYGIDSLPMLARNYEQAARLYQVTRPSLQAKLAENGLMLLYSVPWPQQGLFLHKPIASLSELKGVAWRAHTPATQRIGELIGARPVTVQVAELQRAVANGLIQAFISSCTTGYDTRAYEHLKYWIDIQAWLPKNVVVVNRAAFDALDKPVQAALMKAAADAESRGWAASQSGDEACVAEIQRKGLTVLRPSMRMRQELRDIGQTMQQEWLRRAGADGQALLDEYRKR
jgi:TRAP-type C4-dicarboxylate transport system substrate-binding protein